MSSLTLRISLILTGAMLLVALAVAGALSYQQQHDSGAPLHLPVPEQAAAITELIEETPPERLQHVLRAVNSATLQVIVTNHAPDTAPGDLNLPGVSWVLKRYLDKPGDHSVQAVARAKEGLPSGQGSERPLRMVISLQDGRFVEIEALGGVLRYLLWVRLLGVASLALIFVGGGSLWLLRRQIRPLEHVVDAVERFGENMTAPSLQESGALEVRRLVTAFNRMQARIRALMEGRTRMFAAISHDLGTYLTRLRLRAEFIGDSAQRERAIRDIEEMESLMSDTLALATLERRTEVDEIVDLRALVHRQVAGFVESGARVELHSVIDARVRGQASALNRVISNLIGNALKHAGTADITLQRLNATAVDLLVEDRGQGIPTEVRDLVLEPFYRHDESRNLDVPGFGLGLAIVADIARRHGGLLSLEDRPGGGLRARVTLPSIGARKT